MAVIYNSGFQYIQSCTTLKAKIDAIDAIIDSLQETALSAAANNDINEYWLNDGQTQIKTIYRGAEAVTKSIFAYEKLREYYSAKLNKTRVVRAMDSKNFPSRNWFGTFFR